MRGGRRTELRLTGLGWVSQEPRGLTRFSPPSPPRLTAFIRASKTIDPPTAPSAPYFVEPRSVSAFSNKASLSLSHSLITSNSISFWCA